MAKHRCPECGKPLDEKQTKYQNYGGIPYTWRGHSYGIGAIVSGGPICDYVFQDPTWEQAKKQYEEGR